LWPCRKLINVKDPNWTGNSQRGAKWWSRSPHTGEGTASHGPVKREAVTLGWKRSPRRREIKRARIHNWVNQGRKASCGEAGRDVQARAVACSARIRGQTEDL